MSGAQAMRLEPPIVAKAEDGRGEELAERFSPGMRRSTGVGVPPRGVSPKNLEPEGTEGPLVGKTVRKWQECLS